MHPNTQESGVQYEVYTLTLEGDQVRRNSRTQFNGKPLTHLTATRLARQLMHDSFLGTNTTIHMRPINRPETSS